MKIRVDAFTGSMPRMASNLLPISAAQEAKNVKLWAGSLRSVNTPEQASIVALTANSQSFYMLGDPASEVPLSWSTDVDVAASPISDSEYRVYYTGDGLPKKTTLALATSASAPYPGSNWYYLGVPAPTATPSASTTTGSVPAGTWVYCYTVVTQFGTTLLEESATSPTVTITLSGTGGVALTGMTSPSTTGRNHVYKRIYRTTGTSFQLVAQIPFANTTYTDTLSATGILGDALQTATWTPPPDDLQGICALPSGVLVGFRKNEIWFSEPGYPHAWPVAYMQALDTQIVGIKAFGNNVGVATQAFPYFGSGVHPDGFTFQKMPFLEPCLSKRSLAADEFGMLYASSNGIVSVGSDTSGLISSNAITRDEFLAFAPSTFSSCVYERRYYGFYNDATYGVGAFVFSRNDPGQVTVLTSPATGAAVDKSTARMLFIGSTDNKLYRFDPPTTVPYTYTWKSKLFEIPAAANFSCVRIVGKSTSAADASAQAAVDAANAAITTANASAYASGVPNSEIDAIEINAMAINGSVLTPLIPSIEKTVGFSIWADGNLKLSGDFAQNVTYRLPAGFRATNWEFSVTGQREVLAVEIADSPQELAHG